VDAAILLRIHAFESPFLDRFFTLSHYIGLLPLFLVLVLGMASIHLAQGRSGRALLWTSLGLFVLGSMELLKVVVQRTRPALFPRIVAQGGFSFPSGHALASAAIYPLLAFELGERWGEHKKLFLAVAVLGSAWLGVGRLYLGVHWPSDVLGGWIIGGLEGVAARAAARRIVGGERATAAPRGSD
jgi:membrane-associated phospholipid phosphatase